MSGVAAFGLLLLILTGMVWGMRTLLLALLVQFAERGDIVPVSLTLARVPVPAGETFVLSLPARHPGESLLTVGSLVLTSGRVRLVRRRRVEWDVPVSAVAHLTVQGGTLRITARGTPEPIALRIAQPALVARYIRCLAVRYLSAHRPIVR